MNLDLLIKKVMQKKELSGIDSSLVTEVASNYLTRKNISPESLSEREAKVVLKEMRAELRRRTGMFRVNLKDRKKLMAKEALGDLLKTHTSTKERLSFYPRLRDIISSLGVHSILDLGCGLNPIALSSPSIEYYASDINRDDLGIVDIFFKQNRLPGRTFVCDLNHIEQCTLPEADLCLILKVFDILGEKPYEQAEKVILSLKCRHLIVSFSTRTLSGKRMKLPRRVWFERLLTKHALHFKTVESENEIYYIS